jgi:NADPH:quinone reductase
LACAGIGRSLDCCNEIAADAATGRLDIKRTRVFRFEEIHEAHRVMEAGEARGKMVVAL